MSRPGLQSHSLFCILPSCLVLATFLPFVGVAGGQVNPGMPSFIPQSCGQYDCINIQNLNVSLNIPVMSKSGAFPLNAAMSGEDSYIGSDGTGLVPGIIYTPLLTSANGNVGQLTIVGNAGGTVTSGVACPPGDGTGTATKYQGWYLITADGTRHPLPATDAIYSGTSCSSSLTDTTIDGSGYTLTINSAGANYAYSSGGAKLIGDVTTDSNGSSISYNVATGVFTDTLGVTALTANTSTGALTWTDTNGNPQTLTPTYTSYTLKSSFGCSLTDYTDPSVPLPTSFAFPDSTTLGLVWENNEVTSADKTGRLAQLTLRSGSAVSFNYNPGGATSAPYGFNCSYLVPNSMTRTTSDGTVTYTWAHTSTGNTTTVLDIGQSKTIYTFSSASASSATVLTEVQFFPNSGSVASPIYSRDPTSTVIYCYNSGSSPTVTSCPTATVTLPVLQLAVFTSPNGLSASESYQTFDNYGNVTYSAQYDFGGTSPLVATTNVMAVNGSGVCSAIGATINNKICSSTTVVLGNTVRASEYTYSAAGNLLTTSVSPNGGTSYLSNTTPNSYNANGTPSVLYDLANNSTTFAYSSSYYANCGGCTQYPFATSRTQGGLATYSYYNGYGAVKTEDTDANGNHTFYCYNNTTGTSCNGTVADPWSRIRAIVDPLNNEVFRTYSATSLTADYSFNSGNSVNNVTTTLDGYGRPINVQKQQGPSSSNYDTVSTYRGFSTVIPTVQTTNPCSEPLGTPCGATYGPTVGGTVTGSPHGAAILEITLTQSGSNATTTTTYDRNTVTSVLSPAPSGENTKGTQNSYNGAGWLTSSCGISSVVSGEVSCGGGGTNGIYTTITYSSGSPAGSETVTSCRGPSNQQCRSTTTDGLGRITSKTTPEGGTWTYSYDAACSSAYTNTTGRLAKTVDPNGNTLCYSYDTLGRILLVEATNGTTSSCRWFYYDNGRGQGTASGGVHGNRSNWNNSQQSVWADGRSHNGRLYRSRKPHFLNAHH